MDDVFFGELLDTLERRLAAKGVPVRVLPMVANLYVAYFDLTIAPLEDETGADIARHIGVIKGTLKEYFIKVTVYDDQVVVRVIGQPTAMYIAGIGLAIAVAVSLALWAGWLPVLCACPVFLVSFGGSVALIMQRIRIMQAPDLVRVKRPLSTRGDWRLQRIEESWGTLSPESQERLIDLIEGYIGENEEED